MISLRAMIRLLFRNFRRSTIYAALALGLLSGPVAAQPQFVDVFIGGTNGYPAYRIPALLATKQGSLLAFSEGRASLRDHSENDIVLKRSTDGGKTWGPLQLIDDDGPNALNNPAVVTVGAGLRGFVELELRDFGAVGTADRMKREAVTA